MWQIFRTFFVLGWISFGGPAAHIGYFRNTFVEKLKWLNDEEYGQIVALSQVLPGPGSSQVGFALGFKKGGLPGACSAFLGFTLPSVLLMLALAVLGSQISHSPIFTSIIYGMKLLAVVVVTDACIGMYRNFCREQLSTALCIFTAITLLVLPSLSSQLLVLAVAAIIGHLYLSPSKNTTDTRLRNEIDIRPLVIFMTLLLSLPILAHHLPSLTIFSHFYQAGSMVFGGGHVVLPLLQELVGEQLTTDVFLTGYAAAQAVPGPMFTLATYLGFELTPNAPVIGALIATFGVFIPGFLLMLAFINSVGSDTLNRRFGGAIAGINAAVVGLLISALFQPVFFSAVHSGIDIATILLGLWLLKTRHLSIFWLVIFFAISGIAINQL